MTSAYSLVLPIFGVIGLGYLAVRTRALSDAAIDGLDSFVFTFGIPVLLFRSIARTDIPDILPLGLWASYYGAMLAIWAAGSLFARFVLKRTPGDAVVIGFGGGQGNVVMLGIPVILTGFGAEASVPLFLILTFHGLILITAATFLLELTGRPEGEDVPVRAILRNGLMSSVKNPVIIGLALGVFYGRLGVALPAPVDATAELLGRAAIPCALFVLGGMLTRYHLRAAVATASLTTLFKLVAMPALVYGLGAHVFHLPALWVAVATVLAGSPTGVYSSILAHRYRVAPETASGTVVLSTALSAVTLTLLLQQFHV